MRPHIALVPLAACLAVGSSAPPLNMTALSSRNGYSVLECWQLSSTPVDAMLAANYAVGNTAVATWSRIEPRITVGEARAPHVQITAPAPTPDGSSASVCAPAGLSGGRRRPDTKVAYVMPGTLRSSVLIAADLRAASTVAGHFTEFPSDEPTLLVQIPFVGEMVPAHTVLHDGPCI
ncbi:hypothetical protein BT67DRAFT_378915 [Trichocladium antarcticum]|uniref:Uncharacterized protein n=1 Tax=Trichocladium antarcticum TaxID=1450529 RepID=A0AAN6ULX9_9PEZI|nr:hypothetical protein BT67DRAFT_378915 [Trichocladium antarcticum]